MAQIKCKLRTLTDEKQERLLMIWRLNVFWNAIWQIPITGQKQQQNNLSTNDAETNVYIDKI